MSKSERAWRRSVEIALFGYFMALLVGVAIGQVWPTIAIAGAILLAVYLWRLRGLLLLLVSRRLIPKGDGRGVVDRLQKVLHRRQNESRRRKQRLIRMLRTFREAAAALPDATLMIAERSQRILWFNAATTRLLGLDYPRDIGQTVSSRLDIPRVAAWIDSPNREETLQDVPSPVDPSVRLSFRLIAYSDDQALLVVRDITKLMHLEQVRRDFVANVSHELRTPLTVIHGYLDMIEPDEKPEWASMLDEMRRQSQRMAQIVGDLLTLSRLEAKDSLPEERIDMAQTLAMLGKEARALSQGRHTVTVEDLAGCDLLGSEKELHSAFSNLVSNAVRYTPDGGSISIRFELDDDEPLLSVIDTGYGIPAQHLPRITERFYRVSNSRSRETGGTGLGLSIVKHVLNLHQGRLEVASELGEGSVFSCRFAATRRLARGAGGDDRTADAGQDGDTDLVDGVPGHDGEPAAGAD